MCSLCFELFKMQNSTNFQRICPCTPLGSACSVPPKSTPTQDSPAAQRFFSFIPKKLLGMALIMQVLLIFIVALSKEILFYQKKEHIRIICFELIHSKFIYIAPKLLSFYRFMIASVTGEGSSSSKEKVREGTFNRFKNVEMF